MKPGRKLDSLIVEKVMGGKLIEDGVQWYPTRGIMSIPDYSNNISEAWSIVEKLKINFHEFELELSTGSEGSEEYEVSVKWLGDDDVTRGPFYNLGENPAHAICLGALKMYES